MTRPKILVLFSGAGGACMGYHRAGFDVTGVDIVPQPRYPFPGRFIQGDALAPPVRLERFDAIHASPPCQFGTAYKRRPGVAEGVPNLIPRTRELIGDRCYVIENVDTKAVRPFMGVNPVRLCGSSFGLDVRRHRLFDSSVDISEPPCDHAWQTPRFPPATNRTNLRRTVEVGVWRIPLEVQQRAMGIDWMNLAELSQALPPAYTQHIGEQLLEAV